MTSTLVARPQPRRAPDLALSLPRLWALGALVAVFVACSLTPIALADFWWHLRVGETILATGQVPTVDTYSFVAEGRPYVYAQWLAEVSYALLHRLGGLELVVFANALALAATTLLALLAAREAGAGLRLAAVCALIGLLVGLANRDVRPQTLGFLFFAWFSLTLRRYRLGRPASLWSLPPIAVVWANVHGSAALGLALCGLTLAGELAARGLRRRSASSDPDEALAAAPTRRLVGLAIATAAVGLALLINPRGPGLLDYLLEIQRNPVIQSAVTEWFPPSPRNPRHLPFFLLLLGFTALLARSRRPLDPTDTLLFVAFAWMALSAARSTVWFGIVLVPLLAGQFVALRSSAPRDGPDLAAPGRRDPLDPAGSARRGSPAVNALFALVLLAVAAAASPWAKARLPLPPEARSLISPDTPVAAAAFIRERFPDERFFNADTYGSYLIWANAGYPRVFVDTRVELYPPAVWQDYLFIQNGVEWEERLAAYGIRHVLLDRDPDQGFGLALLAAIERSPDWELLYQDAHSAVYRRRP